MTSVYVPWTMELSDLPRRIGNEVRMKFWMTSSVAPKRSWSIVVSPGFVFAPINVPSWNVRNTALIEYRRAWNIRNASEIRSRPIGYSGVLALPAKKMSRGQSGGGKLLFAMHTQIPVCQGAWAPAQV